MGKAPTVDHSIDRLNNDNGYYKKNCRWATKIEQSRNTSRNRMIEYKGETRCMSEWGELYKIKYNRLVKRMQMGWDIDKALNTPVITSYQRFK